MVFCVLHSSRRHGKSKYSLKRATQRALMQHGETVDCIPYSVRTEKSSQKIKSFRRFMMKFMVVHLLGLIFAVIHFG